MNDFDSKVDESHTYIDDRLVTLCEDIKLPTPNFLLNIYGVLTSDQSISTMSNLLEFEHKFWGTLADHFQLRSSLEAKERVMNTDEFLELKKFYSSWMDISTEIVSELSTTRSDVSISSVFSEISADNLSDICETDYEIPWYDNLDIMEVEDFDTKPLIQDLKPVVVLMPDRSFAHALVLEIRGNKCSIILLNNFEGYADEIEIDKKHVFEAWDYRWIMNPASLRYLSNAMEILTNKENSVKQSKNCLNEFRIPDLEIKTTSTEYNKFLKNTILESGSRTNKDRLVLLFVKYFIYFIVQFDVRTEEQNLTNPFVFMYKYKRTEEYMMIVDVLRKNKWIK